MKIMRVFDGNSITDTLNKIKDWAKNNHCGITSIGFTTATNEAGDIFHVASAGYTTDENYSVDFRLIELGDAGVSNDLLSEAITMAVNESENALCHELVCHHNVLFLIVMTKVM